jgi:hypothetical protein
VARQHEQRRREEDEEPAAAENEPVHPAQSATFRSTAPATISATR